MTPHRSLLAAALVFIGALTATAGAQAPANKPAPCAGIAKEDPAGDNSTYVLNRDTGLPSEANGDLLNVFFNRTAARTTINLTVAEVNRVIPPGSIALAYRVFYTAAGESRYLETGITSSGGDPYFEYGLFGSTGFTEEGKTTGKWHEGPNGVVEIEIPQAAGGKVGTKFSEMFMWPGYLRGGAYTITDYIPDGGDGGTRMTWNGASCPDGSGSPQQPGPAPTPTVPGGPTPGTNPNPGAPAQAQGPLAVSVRPATLKAKKVKRAKKLALKMESREQLTDVVVTLTKGAKTLGAGKLAKLSNISKLSLKLKKKGLKKGSYVLGVSAKRPDGSTGTTTLTLKVK